MLLYIHIPYCDSKCNYCAFNTYVDKFNTQQAYMQALCRQLEFELKRFKAKKQSIETLFIGGGTPSSIDPVLYKPIFSLLAPYLQEDAEITSEANPNSATRTWLKEMKDLGINRISFGVQSFNSDKLKALNRAHTPKQAQDAIINAHDTGIRHISLDLIYNYKGDTKSLLHYDINEAFKLPIDHISAYELTIEHGTAFSKTPEVRQESETLAFFIAKEIKKRGFTHYEVSNFGTYQSRHNKGYWMLKDYIGAGAGAVGFLKNRRFYSANSIEAYINTPICTTNELLSAQEILTEKIFLGLRSNIGIEKTALEPKMLKKAYFLSREKKLKCSGTHFYNKNFFLGDELALYILG